MARTNPRGRFVWHDLLTSDPAAAVSFYTKTLEWGTEPWEVSQAPYTMWTANGASIGGVMPLPAGAESAPPHWLTYIGTADIDATASRASALGATVLVPPTVVPSVGRFAVIRDPQSVVFAAFMSEGAELGHDDPPSMGEFSWHELATADHDAALAFYMDLFGWKSTGRFDMGASGMYLMFGREGRSLGGIYGLASDATAAPNWLPYARIADVNVVAERVTGKGGRLLNGPMEVPGGDWVAMCSDPQGGMFAVHEVRGRG
jgi:predicted enzyme related to lactoylglutathione lyase